jgi:hypothetical protein
LLGLTIGSPLFARAFRHRASLRWQAIQSDNLATLTSLLPDWRVKPDDAELGTRFAHLLGQTQTPPGFWVRETADWTEPELTRLVQFGEVNDELSTGFVELYLSIIRDPGRSDDLRAECFFACIAFPSNRHFPPEQAWKAAASIPDAARSPINRRT